jgi:hypothetical protein
VAEGVVDLLEAIEVDEQQGGERAAAAGGEQERLGLLVQRDAVREVGQAVVGGLVAQAPRCARDEAEQDEPQQEQAGGQRDDQDARVAGDRLRGRRERHVALEDAAADRDVDLDEAARCAQLLLAVLDVGLRVALERLADVRVAAGVPADERVVVGPLDVPGAVVELAAQEAGGLEPAVELGDAVLPQRAGVGLARTQLADDADARHRDRLLPSVGNRAVLDAGMQERAQRDPERGDHHEAEHAERLQQRKPRAARSHTRGRSAIAQRS